MAATPTRDRNGHIPTRRNTVGDERPEPQRPLVSLLASAVRIAGKKVQRPRSESWQSEAWELHDQLGEVRAPAVQFANALSRAQFFVAELPEDATADPVPIKEGVAVEVLDALGGGRLGRQQLIRRIAEQLWVAAESYLVGMVPDNANGDDVPLRDLRWEVVSGQELQQLQGKGTGGRKTTILVDEEGNELDTAKLSVRIWRPHPRKWWEADGPVRSSRGVLRELVGLTKYVSAQIDSRLAGAGILAVAQNATVITGTEQTETSLIDAMVEAMITPIENREAASSFVPLLLQIAGEDASKALHWYKFFTELDREARHLREEAIRRWALGADLPPELLLGMGGANHWTSWLIREDTVTTHLEPMLALIADALTTQFLWPILEEAGTPREQARKFVIWFDASKLTQRPNRVEQATELYDRGELSGAALRREAGFDDEDRPVELPVEERALQMAIEMVQAAPTLGAEPGIPALVQDLRRVLSDLPDEAELDEREGDAGPPDHPVAEDGTPDTLPEEQPGDTDGEPVAGGVRWPVRT